MLADILLMFESDTFTSAVSCDARMGKEKTGKVFLSRAGVIFFVKSA